MLCWEYAPFFWLSQSVNWLTFVGRFLLNNEWLVVVLYYPRKLSKPSKDKCCHRHKPLPSRLIGVPSEGWELHALAHPASSHLSLFSFVGVTNKEASVDYHCSQTFDRVLLVALGVPWAWSDLIGSWFRLWSTIICCPNKTFLPLIDVFGRQ